MYLRRILIVLSLSPAFGVVPIAAGADPRPASASIHASGTKEITLQPQKVRLALIVRAEGTDSKSAIVALGKHKERVRKELLEMKADDSSITFGGPQLSHGIPGMPSEWTSYQTRIFLQSAGSNGAKDAAKMPQVYTATAKVNAEWSLPTDDIDALAILPGTLKEQIEARDLVGLKNKATLDRAKQETLEELQAKMRENYAASTEDSDQFNIAFVAHIDEKTREQALKSAFDNAIARATQLARISGNKLGDLISLRCSESPVNDSGITVPTTAAMMSGVVAGPKVTATNTEDPISPNPGELKVTTKVDVEFAIAK
jgi:uncharacterized protein YggE